MNIFLKLLLRVAISIGIAGCCALIIIVLYVNARLPSVENLEDAQLQVPLRIYTQDGLLIGEYGEKRRSPIDIREVPEKLKFAILATEDRRFYEHQGVDLRGLMRASLHLITRGSKEQGASTITMQVARNFYLTRKKTFTRKLNEILLALKIEKELSKDEILELYLNKIYFGKRAYGVQAASYVYYGKPVTELTLAQMAMLAGLPQAPSAINPLNNAKAGLKRRNHVLNRMHYYGFISDQEYQLAHDAPITAKYHGRRIEAYAPYIAEMARQTMVEKYGREVYTQGLEVFTTVDSKRQAKAQASLQKGLLDYDKRHGYRGPAGHIVLPENIAETDWKSLLKDFPGTPSLLPAVVTQVGAESADAMLSQGQPISIQFKDMEWARPLQRLNYLGPKPKQPADVLEPGDVIYVEAHQNRWILSQIPKVSSALIALNPQTGAIESLVGGFDFKLSKFNRATQAYRQPGSNFKPLVYSAAIERGFTAATIINDAPVVFNDSTLEGVWRPQNDSRRFYGPTRLRIGLTKSRNLVSIRLLQALGLPAALEIIERYGFARHRLPNGLSLALGTVTVTPMEIATSYAAFANGGFKVEPYLIDRIDDINGKTTYQAKPKKACRSCVEVKKEQPFIPDFGDYAIQPAEQDKDLAPEIISPQTAFIMDSILKDAIQTGTGRRAKTLNRKDIAGKTGTTNQQMDAWYSGYHPNLVTTVWVGYDEPQSLKEYGAQAALPIWIDYMEEVLANLPEVIPSAPEGLVTVKIDPDTGLLARPDQSNAIFEYFRKENIPSRLAPQMASEPRVTISPGSSDQSEALF